MTDSLQPIVAEFLFILRKDHRNLSDQILDFFAIIENRGSCCRAIQLFLNIREGLMKLGMHHHRELVEWIYEHFAAVTFCPVCGTKRDLIPLIFNSNSLSSILNNCHMFYMHILRHHYPEEQQVHYTFSYADELGEPVNLNEMKWYQIEAVSDDSNVGWI